MIGLWCVVGVEKADVFFSVTYLLLGSGRSGRVPNEEMVHGAHDQMLHLLLIFEMFVIWCLFRVAPSPVPEYDGLASIGC